MYWRITNVCPYQVSSRYHLHQEVELFDQPSEFGIRLPLIFCFSLPSVASVKCFVKAHKHPQQTPSMPMKCYFIYLSHLILYCILLFSCLPCTFSTSNRTTICLFSFFRSSSFTFSIVTFIFCLLSITVRHERTP